VISRIPIRLKSKIITGTRIRKLLMFMGSTSGSIDPQVWGRGTQ
jgi:hypothetical protein